MQDLYKYYLQINNALVQIFPTGKPQIVYSKPANDWRYGYKEEFKGKLTFSGSDFQALYNIENSTVRCTKVVIRIDKLCGGAYIEGWQIATLTMNNGTWDLDSGTVQIEPQIIYKYSDFDDLSDTDINLFAYIINRKIVNILNATVDSVVRTINVQNGDYYLLQKSVDTTGVTIWDKYLEYSRELKDGVLTSRFARMSLNGEFVLPILFDNPTWTDQQAYVTVDTFPIPTTKLTTIQFGNYPVFGLSAQQTLNNGVLLKDAIQALIDNSYNNAFAGTIFDPGVNRLLIKSDFFQWNPENVSNINYVTGEANFLTNLVLFQKSDAKRSYTAGDSTDATIANTNLKDMLNSICTLLNCMWDVEGDKFIIEHVSWFKKNKGLDLTQSKYLQNVKSSQKYSYNTDAIPAIEHFECMEQNSVDFVGKDITYSGDCISSDKSNGKKDYKADIITTDLYFVLSNTSSDSKNVSDDGFFLCACDINDTIFTQDPVLYPKQTFIDGGPYKYSGDKGKFNSEQLKKMGGVLNNALSWANLHKNFFLHNRVLKNGNMNGVSTEFISTRPVKKQNKLSVPVCCGDIFDPEYTTSTFLGSEGVTDTATFDLNTGMLELNLLFMQEDFNAAAPVANNDTVQIYPGKTIVIDVLQNDTQFNNTAIDPESLSISIPPSKGTATIINGKVQYTANNDAVGYDTFYYTVKDINGVISNLAIVRINFLVLPTALTFDRRLLKNNSFSGWLFDTNLNTVIQNTGNNLQVKSYDHSGANGGTLLFTKETFVLDFGYGPVATFTDKFTYTPATDFIGDETFNYTIEDDAGNDVVGKLIFHVRPDDSLIYIKSQTIDAETGDIIQSCNNGTPGKIGTYKKSKIKFSFFKDSAATIPMDVTGYFVQVLLRPYNDGVDMWLDDQYKNNFKIVYPIPAVSGPSQPYVVVVTTTGTEMTLDSYFSYYEFIPCGFQYNITGVCVLTPTDFLSIGYQIIST